MATTTTAKAKDAADCKEAGRLRPVIDRNRCEAKADCVEVCPYDVFTLGVLPEPERKGLSLKGRLKGWAHGYRQAFAVRAEECHACGKCVTACPEKAIKLSAQR